MRKVGALINDQETWEQMREGDVVEFVGGSGAHPYTKGRHYTVSVDIHGCIGPLNDDEGAIPLERNASLYNFKYVSLVDSEELIDKMDIQSLQEQSIAWNAVWNTLLEVYPAFSNLGMSGMESAVKAIQNLAEHQSTQDDSSVDLLLSIIVDNAKECNGHLQSQMNRPTFKQSLKLCKLIQEYLEDTTDWTGFCEARWCDDGSGDITATSWWKQGEHILGHQDRLIVSWE